MTKRMLTVIAAVALAVGTLGSGGIGASAATQAGQAEAGTAAPKPPKGARAVVRISPNPTTRRGQEVTITGNCGGGRKLTAVIAQIGPRSVLRNIRILKDDPRGFVAKANLDSKIGNGVGPIMVDCGGEAGVTLLVTHV
ncbi:hypothetical protein [Nonomuraea jiangxiensis]|uniref:Neocarzinostatin family protein n=1 Tax=Nonomuraea jiangxiensis TaxID=633440 RepID=A0A1G8QIP1_9ACTN|nr:hypothetical protein [Nonomuraea jiangxiensis]SDJ04506.1 hypothetical protein SAMN05421869_108258 [Nonomuraea jiangxiensis]